VGPPPPQALIDVVCGACFTTLRKSEIKFCRECISETKCMLYDNFLANNTCVDMSCFVLNRSTE